MRFPCPTKRPDESRPKLIANDQMELTHRLVSRSNSDKSHGLVTTDGLGRRATTTAPWISASTSELARLVGCIATRKGSRPRQTMSTTELVDVALPSFGPSCPRRNFDKCKIYDGVDPITTAWSGPTTSAQMRLRMGNSMRCSGSAGDIDQEDLPIREVVSGTGGHTYKQSKSSSSLRWNHKYVEQRPWSGLAKASQSFPLGQAAGTKTYRRGWHGLSSTSEISTRGSIFIRVLCLADDNIPHRDATNGASAKYPVSTLPVLQHITPSGPPATTVISFPPIPASNMVPRSSPSDGSSKSDGSCVPGPGAK